MLTYEFISKTWIVSPRARVVYRTAAVASLMLIPLLWVQINHPEYGFLKAPIFLSVVGMALNTVGMEYFLIRFDTSPAWQQILWFLANVLMPVGPALYCFVVYSRSEVVLGSSNDSERPDSLKRRA